MMQQRLAVAALGTTVEIEMDERDVHERAAVENAWRDARVGAASSSHTVRFPPGPFGRALSDLSTAVTLSAIDARRGQLWMLHACGVADDDGRTVALVGPSGMGKTTATQMLGRTFRYVTDETVGISPDGRVHPYRKPLSIIADDRLPKLQVAASELGLRPLPGTPLQLAAVVLLNRDVGHERVGLSPLSTSESIALLAEHSSYLTALDRPLHTIAELLDSVGGAHRADYRDVTELPALVKSLLHSAATRGPERIHRSKRSSSSVAQLRGARIGLSDDVSERFTQTAYLDALSTGENEHTVLRVDSHGAGRIFVLGGIGATAWAAARGSTRSELSAAIIAHHGAPEDVVDPEARVSRAIDDLVEAGLLSSEPGRWMLDDDVAWVGDDRRVVAMSYGHDRHPVLLEGSAAVIWSVIVELGPISLRALAEELRALFASSPNAISDRTIEPFLLELEDHGLVHRRVDARHSEEIVHRGGQPGNGAVTPTAPPSAGT